MSTRNLEKFVKTNVNGVIALAILLVSLILLFLAQPGPESFKKFLEEMSVSLRGPVTVFCYICFIFLIGVFVSPLGKIRLGGKDAKPEYSMFSWISCLFMAGAGIGIVYYAQEPVFHYFSNPFFAKTDTPAEPLALSLSFFNWTINAWSLYCVLGLVMAYFYFNDSRKLKLSSVIPARCPQWVKQGIDIIMALGVIAGLTTSLGLGVTQICGGMDYLFGIDISPYLLMFLIGLVATWSVYSGLKRGVKWLSNISIVLISGLLVAIVLIGIFEFSIYDFGDYLMGGLGSFASNFFLFNDFTYHEADAWSAAYPIFFDLWFAAWAAFVGVFVAKISKGRTLRQFILAVLGAPVLFTCIWFAVWGRMGIEFKDVIYKTLSENPSTSIFVFFEQVSGGAGYIMLALFTLLVICLFFITSSDSGSYVVSSLLTGRKDNEMIKPEEKIVWSSIQCLVAMALFYMGGLVLVQTVSVIMGILVIALMGIGMIFFLCRVFRKPV